MKKTLVLSFLSVILIMISGCKEAEKKKTNFPNELKNTHWIVNYGGLISPEGESTYDLSKRIDTAFILNFHAIDFFDAEKFSSYDNWECGNDCFTKIYGKYYFTEAHQIRMEVDSISKSEFCDVPTQVFKPSKEMVFDLVKKGTQLTLIRNKNVK